MLLMILHLILCRGIVAAVQSLSVEIGVSNVGVCTHLLAISYREPNQAAPRVNLPYSETTTRHLQISEQGQNACGGVGRGDADGFDSGYEQHRQGREQQRTESPDVGRRDQRLSIIGGWIGQRRTR